MEVPHDPFVAARQALSRWRQDSGLSQEDCPVRVDESPTLTVDRPGAGYGERSAGGLVGGPYQPQDPIDAAFIPGLPPVGPVQYTPNPYDPQSGGQPSGLTGNVMTPTANVDRIPWRIVEPFRTGWAERAFDGGDVQSPGRVVESGGDSALILQRIRQGGGRVSPGVFCQPGEMPPTFSQTGAAMASHTVTVQRRSGDTFSPIPVGGKVMPGEAVRYRSDGGNLPFDTVKFRVIDMLGGVVFEFTANLNSLLSGWVDTIAPALEGVYTLTAEVRSFPFLTTTHFADTFFIVDQDAPPPPKPPPGGSALGDVRGIVIALAILAGIVIVAPVITSRIGRG